MLRRSDPLMIQTQVSESFAAAGHRTVITVCDHANQACPIFPGQVNRHHWAFDDPALAPGTEAEKLAVFRRARDEIRRTFEAYGMSRRAALKAMEK